MTFALRPLARSSRLRAMGMLAWLMLVINSLAAAPMGMMKGTGAHPMHATAAATSEHSHHRVASQGSCCDDRGGACGDRTGFTCHCVTMCSTTLPTAGVAVLARVAIAVRYAMLLPDSAPSLDTAPPLRPPAV